MRGVAAQRIVRAIRKPRNKADEAIAPKPGGTGAFRAICFVAHLSPESFLRGHAGLVQRFQGSAYRKKRERDHRNSSVFRRHPDGASATYVIEPGVQTVHRGE
jgi:hypothetical protein